MLAIYTPIPRLLLKRISFYWLIFRGAAIVLLSRLAADGKVEKSSVQYVVALPSSGSKGLGMPHWGVPCTPFLLQPHPAVRGHTNIISHFLRKKLTVRNNLNYWNAFPREEFVYLRNERALWWGMLICSWQLFSEQDRNQIGFRQREIESLLCQQEAEASNFTSAKQRWTKNMIYLLFQKQNIKILRVAGFKVRKIAPSASSVPSTLDLI